MATFTTEQLDSLDTGGLTTEELDGIESKELAPRPPLNYPDAEDRAGSVHDDATAAHVPINTMAGMQAQEEYEDVKKAGFLETLKDEWLDPTQLMKKTPWFGGFVGMAEAVKAQQASKRLRDGFDYTQPVTNAPEGKEDVSVHLPVYHSQATDAKTLEDYSDVVAKDRTFFGKVAKGVSVLPTWALEFYLTGGLNSVGKEATRQGLMKVLGQHAKTKAGKAALRAAGWGGGAITRATVGLTPRIGEKATERQLQAEIGLREDEGWATSYLKAWGDITIEAASEEAGQAITGLGGKVLRTTKLGAKIADGLKRAWVATTGGSGSAFNQILEKGGYSNILGEIGEERLGTILRAIVNVDDFGAGPDANVLERLSAGLEQDLKNLPVEATVLAVPSAGQSIVNRARTKTEPVIIEGENILRQEQGEAATPEVLARERIKLFESEKNVRLSEEQSERALEFLTGRIGEPSKGKLRGIIMPSDDEIAKAAGVTLKASAEEIKQKQIAKTKKLTDKALVELGKAERPRQIIEAEKTKELGRRAARSAAAAQKTTGEQRLTSALGQLKGPLTEYKRPDFKPLRETMSKGDINELHDDIWQRPHTDDHFSRLNTAQAWNKVVDGFVPTRGEIVLLEKQWGKEFAKGLLKKRPFGDRAWDAAADISNFMRTMIAGGDMSVAGRQLRVLGQRYPKEFAKAIKGGVDAYRSEKLSEIVRAEYESSPFHAEAKKHLKFFDPAGMPSTEPADRPEFYISNYPERVPIVGHLIRMGNRNYVETTNSLTQSIWDKLRNQDKVNGFEPTPEQLDLRGKWIMSMSGRPEIASKSKIVRQVQPIASGFFFAPRFAVSRFTSPTYLKHLASQDPVAREVGRETAKAFASFVGTNIAVLTLLQLGGADIELDPRSPDWGKGKIGNTRFDLWAGYQQAARFLVQTTLSMLTPVTGVGAAKTQAGEIVDPPTTELIGRFVRGKENPLVSLISDLWAGKTYEGDRVFSPPKGEMGKRLDELKVPELVQGVGKEAYNRMTFLWVQDFVDASVSDGWTMGFTAGTLSFFGNNTSSYEDSPHTKIAKFKNMAAQSEYDKDWKDLGPKQQATLTRTNKDALAEMKIQADIEGLRRDDFDFVGRMIEDEKKAGKQTHKQLKPENQKILDSVGHKLGLSRKLGAWELNDKRYKRYQEIAAEILDDKLSRVNLKNKTLAKQKEKIDNTVQAAKDKAKAQLRREARE